MYIRKRESFVCVILVSVLLSSGILPAQSVPKKDLSIPSQPGQVKGKGPHVRAIESACQGKSAEDAQASFDAYLRNITPVELVTVVRELAAAGLLDQTVSPLAPHVKNLWAQEFPVDDICRIIEDESEDDVLRAFLIGTAASVPEVSAEQKHQVLGSVMRLAKSARNASALRRSALLEVHEFAFSTSSSLSFSALDTDLRSVLSNPSNPGDVRGAALTAMRRIDSPSLTQSLNETLEGQVDESAPMLIRHAVVTAGKSKKRQEFLPSIRRIALETNKEDVYGSAIYALGLLRGADAVKAIMDAAYRFDANHRSVRVALRKNELAILEMLRTDTPKETGLIAVEAARLALLESTLFPLKELSAEHRDEEVRKRATSVLDVIQDSNLLMSPEISRKWRED